MDNYTKQQKLIARKNKAKYSRELKKSSNKVVVLEKMANEQKILDFKVEPNTLDNFEELVYNIRKAEVAIELPGAAGENPNLQPIPKVNFGQFMEILERDFKQEDAQLNSEPQPSQTDLIRWARKWAFLQYYKSINMSPDQPITKTFGDDKTLRELAPNKETIFKLFLDKLEELKRRNDKFQITDNRFDNTLYNGTPHGGGFEKWLERHREEMFNKVYQS